MDMNYLIKVVVYVFVIMMVWQIVSKIIDMFKGRTRKYKEIPKDFLQRLLADLIVSSKLSHQRIVKRLYVSGDKETKPVFIGWVGGTLPDRRMVSIPFSKSRIKARLGILSKSKILLTPPELIDTDFDSKSLYVRARGIMRIGKTVFVPLVTLDEKEDMKMIENGELKTVPITQENVIKSAVEYISSLLNNGGTIDIAEISILNMEVGAVPSNDHIGFKRDVDQPRKEPLYEPRGGEKVVTEE